MLNLLIWGLYGLVLYIMLFQFIVFLEKDELKSSVAWRTEWPSLTVTIPAYNEEETIQSTLASVLAAHYPADKLQVLVVDDGSRDATAEKVQAFTDRPQVQLISQDNQGKGAALNTGLVRAEGRIFACVDADSRIAADALKYVVSQFDEDTGGVASAMKVDTPANQLQRIQWLEYVASIFIRSIMDHVNAIHVTPGPLSVYRTDVLNDLGGFDEDAIVEDQEICFRLQKHHWKVKHSRQGEVYTCAPSTLRGLYQQRKRWYKGALENLWRYRDMMFNREYGEFGVFALPTKLMMGGLSIVAVALMVSLAIPPVLDVLSRVAQIGWDAFVPVPLNDLATELYWGLLGLQTLNHLLLLSLVVLSATLTYLAGRHTEERILSHGGLPAFVYIVWFVFFMGTMWLLVGLEMLSERVVPS